jgi:muramoyltetrapeptide carboxypeptidase LdcA involved in peptidoglycan recycling
MELITPRFLRPGDTIGIFTPSFPAYHWNPELFENGIRNLQNLGFKVVLGSLTERRASQGYRSAEGQARAREFMELIRDPNVHALISTIGGYNSNSMVPYLDFAEIRSARKVICGYSDVTSLHLAIHKHAALQTFYGPAVMCWFGEWPDGIAESVEWFLDAVIAERQRDRVITAPRRWSNHRRDWATGAWKSEPRRWVENEGWRVLSPGSAHAPILPVNLNTLMASAGTSEWPEMRGRLLLLEEECAPMPEEERALRQLQRMGVFNEIAGLIVSKPEIFESREAAFTYDDLIREMVGRRDYPIVSNFDCGHTVPMITIPMGARARLEAGQDGNVTFSLARG